MATLVRARDRLSYADLLAFPADGKTHQVIDGKHYVSPSPSTRHQAVSGALFFQLYRQIAVTGKGVVLSAPTDLELTDHDIVVPDIMVILKERRGIIRPRKVTGSPDLVVEIVSPSSARQDRRVKRSLYAQAGVPEYWIVEPERELVEPYRLRGSAYRALNAVSGTIAMTTIEDVKVDLQAVWRAAAEAT